jgi:hypothetical protein
MVLGLKFKLNCIPKTHTVKKHTLIFLKINHKKTSRKER